MCSVTKMPQAAFTSWLGISWESSCESECWGNRVMLRRQFCLYWGLRADGAWETDSVVMETELILREDVCGLIGGFIECFEQEGATVCVIWEAACLGRYGNQKLADWLLVELMFKRHLRDRHMHTHMIEFRAGWPNLRVSLAMKPEKGIKKSYYTYTQSKHSNSYMHSPIKSHLFPQDINKVSEEQWGYPFPDKREETSDLITKTCTKTSHLYININTTLIFLHKCLTFCWSIESNIIIYFNNTLTILQYHIWVMLFHYLHYMLSYLYQELQFPVIQEMDLTSPPFRHLLWRERGRERKRLTKAHSQQGEINCKY